MIDDLIAQATWRNYDTFVEIVGSQDLTIAAGGGTLGGASIMNSLEVDRLDLADSAGYGHVYKLNYTGDPVPGPEIHKGEDAPGWTGVYTGHAGVGRASIWPRQYLSKRSTLSAGWVSPDGGLDIANLGRKPI